MHSFLTTEQNKVVAHTDIDRMRFFLTSFEVGDRINFPYVVEDEGFALLGKKHQFEAWLRKLIQPLASEVYEFAQGHEPKAEFRQDYLHNNPQPIAKSK